ncbi:MAG: ribosome silencing factor [Chlorobiota bacterium]
MTKNTLTDSEKLAILCAQAAEDKLAENTIILDLNEITIASSKYLVICNCPSTTQVKSITDNILNEAVNHGLKKPRIEGQENSEWVILDFFDVVVHIFLSENRAYYKLEKLWADANFYTVNENAELLDTEYESIKVELEKIENEI